MNTPTDLMCREGSSSQAKRRLDLVEEIIKISDCDMAVMAERFKLTLIGRVLHRGSRSIEALISQLPRPRIWNVEGTWEMVGFSSTLTTRRTFMRF
ncbi:hypothetical protein Bca52824_095401 [Brassica carinata]|uniref:Uncharacterized protein n=1 Tax=Brassica carinata TaxID=52824 RepID=A0A8X7TIA2_BRACI|nr:hypothetical protein Bca52824_095401 [Brassica carinata]